MCTSLLYIIELYNRFRFKRYPAVSKTLTPSDDSKLIEYILNTVFKLIYIDYMIILIQIDYMRK